MLTHGGCAQRSELLKRKAQLAEKGHADHCPHSWDNYKEAICDLQVQVPSHSPAILRGLARCVLSALSLWTNDNNQTDKKQQQGLTTVHWNVE